MIIHCTQKLAGRLSDISGEPLQETSPCRRQMLAVLLLRPDEQFHVRQLERLMGISAGSLHRELKAMASAGLLTRANWGQR